MMSLLALTIVINSWWWIPLLITLILLIVAYTQATNEWDLVFYGGFALIIIGFTWAVSFAMAYFTK